MLFNKKSIIKSFELGLARSFKRRHYFYWKRFLFVLIYIFAALFLIDTLIGVFFPCGLVFSPNRTIYYKTPEYNITVFTNNLGFRDRNFSQRKGAAYRIVVIGDSFTYGWGVNLDQSWTKILERNLQNKNINVEILNLGFPTGETYSYKILAERVIPYLKPDLLILAIEQGGDLAQLKQYVDCSKQGKSRILNLPFKNITNVFNKVDNKRYDILNRVVSSAEIKLNWKNTAKGFLVNNNGLGLPDHIKKLLLAGELNPALASYALKDKYSFYYGYDYNDPLSKKLLSLFEENIKSIQSITEKNKCKLLIVNSPMGAYCSRYQHNILKEQGLFLTEEMLFSGDYDKKLEDICNKYSIRCYSFTKEFRMTDRVTPLFYRFDGHFNIAGNLYLANLLTDKIQPFLKN